jgi:hypothetical protein
VAVSLMRPRSGGSDGIHATRTRLTQVANWRGTGSQEDLSMRQLKCHYYTILSQEKR